MKKINVLVLVLLFVVLGLNAQSVREEIKADPCKSASNYMNYPGPLQQVLTSAPEGYKPFYLSHYGRHGSRYLCGKNEYIWPAEVLEKADADGALTSLGCSVMERLEMMRTDSYKRIGELTLLGAQQHKGIAKRMMERFPEVFADSTVIDAKSTVVIRCILSMENELQQMLTMNPKLKISHDASEHDMFFMNLQDDDLYSKKMSLETKAMFKSFCDSHIHQGALMLRLFKDTTYLSKNQIDSYKLYTSLFNLASILQDSELRHKFSLYDIFTTDELYSAWQMENVWWYLNYGACPFNGGTQPFSQRNLLRNIIQQADSCIALPKPGATLRFGHETMVMPLVCLLGLNGFDKQIKDINNLEKEGWINYHVFPMGCNVQFVFYRRFINDKDVLVKVLLNENEATLPVALKPISGPYYRWSDVRQYYLQKLSSYKD